MAAKEISGTFTGPGEFSDAEQGQMGTIVAGSGTAGMQLEIRIQGSWYKEGTSILQGEAKNFRLDASLPVRLASEGSGTLEYAMHIR